MSTAKTFEAVATGKPARSRGCSLCGKANAGRVLVQVQRVSESGRADKQVRSKSWSLCEAHAVEVYLELEESLLSRVKGDA